MDICFACSIVTGIFIWVYLKKLIFCKAIITKHWAIAAVHQVIVKTNTLYWLCHIYEASVNNRSGRFFLFSREQYVITNKKKSKHTKKEIAIISSKLERIWSNFNLALLKLDPSGRVWMVPLRVNVYRTINTLLLGDRVSAGPLYKLGGCVLLVYVGILLYMGIRCLPYKKKTKKQIKILNLVLNGFMGGKMNLMFCLSFTSTVQERAAYLINRTVPIVWHMNSDVTWINVLKYLSVERAKDC